MKKEIKMSAYVIHAGIALGGGIAFGIFFFKQTASIIWVTIVLELLIITLLHQQIIFFLVLPLDLVKEPVVKEVYFRGMLDWEYLIFDNKYYCEWNFRYSAKGKLSLIVPVCLPDEMIFQMEKPVLNQKVRVCYYKYSKILKWWEVVE